MTGRNYSLLLAFLIFLPSTSFAQTESDESYSALFERMMPHIQDSTTITEQERQRATELYEKIQSGKAISGDEMREFSAIYLKTQDEDKNSESGGCLIATAAYGSEMAPQVQFLREIRDGKVMSTSSGAAFMTGFNQLYYSFSPTIADWERENPIFQEIVRTLITPMIYSLSIMTLADSNSEIHVLGLGVSVIVLNFGMYIAAPSLAGYKIHKYLESKLSY